MVQGYFTKLSTTTTGAFSRDGENIKYYNNCTCRDIVDWLIDKYPESMNVRDNVSTSQPFSFDRN